MFEYTQTLSELRRSPCRRPSTSAPRTGTTRQGAQSSGRSGASCRKSQTCRARGSRGYGPRWGLAENYGGGWRLERAPRRRGDVWTGETWQCGTAGTPTHRPNHYPPPTHIFIARASGNPSRPVHLLKQGTGNVARASGDNVVEAHHLARVREALGEHDVADGNDRREAERDERQRAVPAVVAVVRGQDDLGCKSWAVGERRLGDSRKRR